MIVALVAIAATWLYARARRRQALLTPVKQRRPWAYAVASESAEFLLPLALAAWAFVLVAATLLFVGSSSETTYATLNGFEAWRRRLVGAAGRITPAAATVFVLALAVYMLMLRDRVRWRRMPQVLKTSRKWVGRTAKLSAALGFFTFSGQQLDREPYDLTPRIRLLEAEYDSSRAISTRTIVHRAATQLADSAMQALPPPVRTQLAHEVSLHDRVEMLARRVKALDPRTAKLVPHARRLVASNAGVMPAEATNPKGRITGERADVPRELTKQHAREMLDKALVVELASSLQVGNAGSPGLSEVQHEFIGASFEMLAGFVGATVPAELVGSTTRLLRCEIGPSIVDAAYNVVVEGGLVPRIERAVDVLVIEAMRRGTPRDLAHAVDEEARRLAVRRPRVEITTADGERWAREESALSGDLERAEHETSVAEVRSKELRLRDRWNKALATPSGAELPEEGSLPQGTREELGRQRVAARDAFWRALEQLDEQTRRIAVEDVSDVAARFDSPVDLVAALTLATVGQHTPPAEEPLSNALLADPLAEIMRDATSKPLTVTIDSRPPALRTAQAQVAREVWGREIDTEPEELSLSRLLMENPLAARAAESRLRAPSPLVLRLSRSHLGEWRKTGTARRMPVHPRGPR